MILRPFQGTSTAFGTAQPRDVRIGEILYSNFANLTNVQNKLSTSVGAFETMERVKFSNQNSKHINIKLIGAMALAQRNKTCVSFNHVKIWNTTLIIELS